MFQNDMDWFPLYISLKTSLCAAAIAFGLGVTAARLVFGMRGKAKAVIDGLLMLPLVLPPTVVGFCLLIFLGRNSFFGILLQKIGIRVIFSWEATVIAATVVAFPLVYRTVRSSLEQIEPSVLEAARILGVSEWTIFFRIMLPYARSGCIAGTILGFTRALGEFGATLMIAGNIPHRTQTIPIAIWSSVEGNEMNAALIWTLLIIVLSFFVVIPLNFYGEQRRT
ncbi:MAG: molybdate ABC transporter permease subunit [Planctomycetaceae bacterium]|jgi:molybdate transport system permease protein|nr:molybdate ABC transporter permease subunit [Planctomycetaceae bacterium]